MELTDEELDLLELALEFCSGDDFDELYVKIHKEMDRREDANT